MGLGYPIAAEAIDLEIYRLASHFAGSSRLAEIEKDDFTIQWVRKTFEKSEVSRRLVGLAVMVRSQIDNYSVKADNIVGQLIRDLDHDDDSLPCNLRSACNKIIHAENIEFSTESIKLEAPLTDDICIYGTLNKTNWKLVLNIFKFLSAASLS